MAGGFAGSELACTAGARLSQFAGTAAGGPKYTRDTAALSSCGCAIVGGKGLGGLAPATGSADKTRVPGAAKSTLGGDSWVAITTGGWGGCNGDSRSAQAPAQMPIMPSRKT